MTYKAAYTDPDPEPGEVLSELRETARAGRIYEIKESVQTLGEQRHVAEERHRHYLENIADAPGARAVIERFYEERHGEDVDASDPDALHDRVPDVDALLEGNGLPRFDKRDLRDRFGVEGVYGGLSGVGHDPDLAHLTPRWVIEHDEEPYRIVQSSGTTGRPWGRAMTRNDWATHVTQYVRFNHDIMMESDLEPEDTNVAVYLPGTIGELATASVDLLGADGTQADFDALGEGGETAKAEAERTIAHVNEGDTGMIIAGLATVMEGKLGVALRRGDVDAELVVNGGQPLLDDHRDALESQGMRVVDFYGETEYPMSGGRERTIDGTTGYDLPFDAQLNLVFDEDAGTVSDRGRGRFAYLPFGLEGIAVPGIYVSGVRASLTRLGDRHQLLDGIERVEDPGKGCYAVINV